MKVLSLCMSVIVFGIAAYFFATDFRNSTELNYIIYMSMLLILMSICVVGMMINVPLLVREKRKIKRYLYGNLSKKKLAKKNDRVLRLKRHNYVREEPGYQDMI